MLIVTVKMIASFFDEGVLRHEGLVSRQAAKECNTRLKKILYNSTNQMSTSKPLRCFSFFGPYSSDVQPVVCGLDI